MRHVREGAGCHININIVTKWSFTSLLITLATYVADR